MTEITFLKEIYRYEAILSAIRDYKGIARIELVENEVYYCCSIWDSEYNENLVADEFGNYVLGLMNQ